MKKTVLALILLIITSCGVKLPVTTTKDENVIKYMNTINADDLRTDLTFIASDKTEGRETGSEGQKMAGKYIVNVYKKLGIPSPKGAKNYYQTVPATFMNKFENENLPDSENICAFIEGSEKPNEVLVISAHYDHIGIDENGKICNGADDDGSGTSALLEIAQAFQLAKKDGHGPKRSILFLHVTGEEHGLFGSQYYTENPLFPLKNTITDINIDMIGRRDDRHPKTNNYIYIIGSDYLSSDLFAITENANSCYTKLEFDYKFNDRKDPNRYYYRSDHYNFAKNGIPSVFLFNGVHDDYHKESDEVSKIEFDALTKRTQLAFAMAWELANRDKRPVVDKKG
jgi:Peptidase family M28